MNRTLLLRLDGPMQSWGTDSRFGIRDTRREPTKSGVVGLVAAALGRERDEPVDDLAALAFGVRVDREGQVLRDFHTAGAGGFYRASGQVERKNVIVSDRFYLADACFTAGLEARDAPSLALLDAAHRALLNPRWIPFLGRRAFPPAAPVALGVADAALLDALRAAPRPRWTDSGSELRFVFDAGVVDAPDLLKDLAGADVPVSFQSDCRLYRLRETVTLRLPLVPAP